MSHKKGKLSNQEMELIRQNCFDLSVEEIANMINRTTAPVQRFIDKENLKARDLSDAEHLLMELRSRYYYKELSKQFSKDETSYFEHQWADYFSQFAEDVTHTEEMQILETIRTEVLINRGMQDRKEVVDRISGLQSLIDEEMDKPANIRDTNVLAAFHTQMGAAVASKSAYINEHEKLLTKKERLIKDLKGTREQRKRNAEDAKTNFSAWLKYLDNEEIKKQQGYDMEVQRVAADKARERLAEYHQYEDGQVDRPIYNDKTSIMEEEK